MLTITRLCLSAFLFLAIFFTACKSNNKLVQGQGFVNTSAGKVWYRISGTGNNAPVMLLHGGPGSTSFYLKPLEALGKDRPVIFIDQPGCGHSEEITDTALMTTAHFVDAMEEVRKALGLTDYYLYGHSWGTMLGIDYYLKYPAGIKGIIFSSPLFSTERWIKDADTLIATLPDSVQNIIKINEQNKSYSNQDYIRATNIYYEHFLTRNGKQAADTDHTSSGPSQTIYEYMWGPSEFKATGNLTNYDRLNDLGTIKVPSLLLCGEYDEARPNTVQFYQQKIPGSKFIMIPNSGHSTMSDNPAVYLLALADFLNELDKK